MKLISSLNAAKMMGMPEGTLRYWRVIGRGPQPIHIFGRVKYDVADVEAFIESCRQASIVREHKGAL